MYLRVIVNLPQEARPRLPSVSARPCSRISAPVCCLVSAARLLLAAWSFAMVGISAAVKATGESGLFFWLFLVI